MIIKEQKDYYPFGKEHENPNLISSTNRWGFSGKEKQTVKDLGYLDFIARMYANSEIPMFTTQDPLAEKYYSVSPYMYCAGNPLRYVDPNGEDFKDILKGVGNAVANGAKWVGNGIIEITRGTFNSALTVVAIPQIIAGNVARNFTENGKYPNWAVPIQWEDDGIVQKESWLKEKLSWEDGKDVMKNTLGAFLFFVPFSNATTTTERFIENTVISTGISTVANEVLPSQTQSTDTNTSTNADNNNSGNNMEIQFRLLIEKTMQQYIKDLLFYDHINHQTR
jgi:RHS repeat-associated protein